MNVKKILIGISASGLVISSLSLSACGSGGGGGSSSTGNPPTPVVTPAVTPPGFQNPVSSGSTNPTASAYLQFVNGILANLAVPQGVAATPLVFNAPLNITRAAFTSAYYQLFNFVSGAHPTIIVTSGPADNSSMNVAALPVASANAELKAALNVAWVEYSFPGVNSTSSPIGVFTNNVAYIGTSINPGGAFLAMQEEPEPPEQHPEQPTHPSNPPAEPPATPAACQANALSTAAVAIANTSFNNGDNYIAIGTNYGELLVFGVAGSQAGQCRNLTLSNGVAQQGYSFGSPIIALSYTKNRPGIDPNNYGYFLTGNGQIWRIKTDSTLKPTGFVQINGGNTYSGAMPPAGNVGVLTALYSDAKNNVYAGDVNGNIYLLGAVTSTGVPNTIWTKTLIGTGSKVLSISATTNGAVVAITAAGVYNIAIVAQ